MRKLQFKHVLWVLGFIWAFSLLSTLGTIATLMAQDLAPIDEDHIGLVKIEGPLMDAMPKLEEIRKLKQNPGLKGVLFRIDTPGGAVGAAQEIYMEMEKLRADSLPVVVSYGNISASGGVYASGAADFIFSLPGTLTGSIGVITQFPKIAELAEKVGVEMRTLKSGELKDVGNPFRDLSKKEKEALQNVIDNSYEQFVEALLKYRNIEKETLRQWADGRVFTGLQAQQIGLVDSLGSYTDAKAYIKLRAGLADSVKVLEMPEEKDFMTRLMEAPQGIVKNSLASWQKGVFYLWD